MKIYVGDKSSRQGYWTSFETSPDLEVTRGNIYARCVPCIEGLLEQLSAGGMSVELKQALDCWKVVIVLDREDDCLKLLEVYEDQGSVAPVRGRFGSREKDGQKAVIFNMDSEDERDRLVAAVKRCAAMVKADAPVFFSRGCAFLHGHVLGDGGAWTRLTPVRHPENVAEVIRRCRKSLYDW